MSQNTNQALNEMTEKFLSNLPGRGTRAKSISTQVRRYVAALTVRPPVEDEDDGTRILDMSLAHPQLRPPKAPAAAEALRPVDASGRLPLLPMNRKKARELYGFTLQEVALAARTTVTTAKIYEEHRSSIRRNDKRRALDAVYRMFVEPAL